MKTYVTLIAVLFSINLYAQQDVVVENDTITYGLEQSPENTDPVIHENVLTTCKWHYPDSLKYTMSPTWPVVFGTRHHDPFTGRWIASQDFIACFRW